MSPSRKRHPILAMVAAVAVAGPQTIAQGRDAKASFFVAQAAIRIMSLRGTHEAQAACAHVIIG